jgi:hypothetical protein
LGYLLLRPSTPAMPPPGTVRTYNPPGSNPVSNAVTIAEVTAGAGIATTLLNDLLGNN